MVTIKAWFKRVIGWFNAKCAVLDAQGWAHVVAVIVLVVCAVMLFVTGCAKKTKPEVSKPAPVQATTDTPVDAFASVSTDASGFALDPSFEPDVVILRPGQTAMLLENAEVEARIPYQGGELWTGRVVIEKGSMVVKPLVEGD